MAARERTTVISFIAVGLFIISIGFFAYAGIGSIDYLLSNTFGVETQKTILDFIKGIVTLAASALIFIGAIGIWNMKPSSYNVILWGSIGFILKNFLEIANSVYNLSLLTSVTRYNILHASAAIGNNIFHLGFWIFIIVFFYALFRKE